MDDRKTLGRFDLVEPLGREGMGFVYRATDPLLRREVAVKILSDDLLADEQSRARFHREARAIARLHHHHVITVFEFGEEQGTPYLVMELLRGQSLAQRLAASPTLVFDQKLDIAAQLCAGLNAVHEHGIIHRNVRPATVWIEPDGNVKLLDFGIASLTSTTLIRPAGFSGGVRYMAPELMAGAPVDHRADIFSAGMMLYDLLSGTNPSADDAAPIAVNVAALDRLAPQLPPRLRNAVTRSLHSNPAERFQSAHDFGTEIEVIRSLSWSLQASRADDLANALYAEPPDGLLD